MHKLDAEWSGRLFAAEVLDGCRESGNTVRLVLCSYATLHPEDIESISNSKFAGDGCFVVI